MLGDRPLVIYDLETTGLDKSNYSDCFSKV